MGLGKGKASAPDWRAFALALIALGASCSRNDNPVAATTDATNSPQKRTSMGMVVEDLAGRTDIKAGQRAQETIRRVSKQEQTTLDEVLEK